MSFRGEEAAEPQVQRDSIVEHHNTENTFLSSTLW